MEKVYFDSGYDITEMLRALFNSESFKMARFAKVKNPAEMVVGTMRLVGEHRDEIKPGLFEISQEPKYMGMDLMNPPTVEGWHTGHEWIDSGTLVERINFAADYLGKTSLSGVQTMIINLMGQASSLTPEEFVNGCIDQVGCLNITEDTKQELLTHANRDGNLTHANDAEKGEFARRSGEMFQMLAATSEYQFG